MDKVGLFVFYLNRRDLRAQHAFEHISDGDKFLVILGGIASPPLAASALGMFFLTLGLLMSKIFAEQAALSVHAAMVSRLNYIMSLILIFWSIGALGFTRKILSEKKQMFRDVGII
jgi:hypothetical protein